MKRFLFLIPLVFCFSLFAQTPKFTTSDFRVTGDAVASGEQCFQLTSARMWQGGSVWYKNPINLNEPFEMEIDLNFGCDDFGADGIVFIFHDKLRTGMQGEGMGFGGLSPSLGIEMDTYENPRQGDPYFDHMALMKNGRPTHDRYGIMKPVSILPDKKNIEDCSAHRVAISWNPTTYNIKVTIDGSTRINKTYDIVGRIFRNNPNVYWGFSAATGGEHNVHKVCLEKIEFTEVANFDTATKKKLLEGETYSLKDVEFPSSQVELQPESLKELDKVIALMKENGHLDIFIDGHTDSSGSAQKNKQLSKKRANAVADYLKEKGISKDRIHAEGRGEAFPKTTNSTQKGRRLNRRIDVYLVDPRA